MNVYDKAYKKTLQQLYKGWQDSEQARKAVEALQIPPPVPEQQQVLAPSPTLVNETLVNTLMGMSDTFNIPAVEALLKPPPVPEQQQVLAPSPTLAEQTDTPKKGLIERLNEGLTVPPERLGEKPGARDTLVHTIMGMADTFNIPVWQLLKYLSKGIEFLSEVGSPGPLPGTNEPPMRNPATMITKALEDNIRGAETRLAQGAEHMQKGNTLQKFIYEGAKSLPSVATTAMTGGALGAKVAADLSAAAGGLIGSTPLAQALTAKMATMAPFGLHAAGSYAREAEREGASTLSQLAYATSGAIFEILTEAPIFSRWAETIGKVGGDLLIRRGTESLLRKWGAAGLRALTDALAEAGQEVIVGPMAGVAKKTFVNKDMPWLGEGGVVDFAQMPQDAFGGFAMSTLLTAFSLPVSAVSKRLATKALNDIEKGRPITLNEIVEINKQLTMDLEKYEDQIKKEAKEAEETAPTPSEFGAGAPITSQQVQSPVEGVETRSEAKYESQRRSVDDIVEKKTPGERPGKEEAGKKEVQQPSTATGEPVKTRDFERDYTAGPADEAITSEKRAQLTEEERGRPDEAEQPSDRERLINKYAELLKSRKIASLQKAFQTDDSFVRMTPEQHQEILERAGRQDYTRSPRILSEAIDNKDVKRLLSILTVPENVVSKQMFKEITGVDVGKTVKSAVAAIKTFVGESAYQQHLKQQKAEQKAREEARHKEEMEEELSKVATLRTPEGVEKTATYKEIIEDLLAKGFTPEEGKRGAIPVVWLTDGDHRYRFTNKQVKEYIRQRYSEIRKPDTVPTTKPEPRKPVNKALVNTLRKQAQNLDKQIEAKKNPAIASQNLTARRARIAASMREEGERLERQQQVLNKLADLHESGDIPDSLSKITARTQIDQLERLMRVAVYRAYQAKAEADYEAPYDAEKHGKYATIDNNMPPEELNRLKRIGVTNAQQLRQVLKDFAELGITKQEPDQAKKLRDMEAALIGAKIPGYFPTPKPIAKDMVERADIKPGMKVLEPSAGKGNIADEVPKDADLDVIEINYTLREILKEKGYNIVGSDFLEHKGEYDRIVMNPPFEKGQDIDHVRHAYDLLKPSGKLVSIMSEGPFFRSDKKATEFREWFEEVGGTSEKLPAGSFTGPEAERQTGVSVRIVEIEKQADTITPSTQTDGQPYHTEKQIEEIIKKAGFRDIEEAQEAFYGSGLPISRKKVLDNKLAKLPQDKLEQIKFDLQYFAEAKRWKNFTPEEKDKAKKLIREMKKVSSKLKYMRPEYRDAIKAVLDEIDLPVISRRRATVRKLESLREYVKRVPDNNVPDYLIEKTEILDKKAIRDMTLDELQEVHDTVMGLAKQEELKNILLFKRGKTEFSKVKAQAIANVKKLQLNKRDPKNIDTTDQSLAPKGAKAFLRKHENMETLSQRLDGSQKGIIYKVFYEGIDDGRDEQLGLKQQVFELIEEEFKKAKIGDIMNFSESFNTKKKDVAYQKISLDNGKTITITKAERIEFLLHSRNKDNVAHILNGGFSFEKDQGTIHNITAKDFKKIIDSATAEERRIADVFSNVYNGILKLKLNERWVELNGWEVARVPNYYPIKVNRMDLEYDPMKPRNRTFSAAILENLGIFKERKKGKNAIIIGDAFKTMYRHIETVSAYYGMAKPLRNMRMLLLDKDFRQELAKVDGDFTWRMLDQYVKDIEAFSTDMEYIDKLATDLMQKIDTSILAFNPWVVLKQPISLILELNEIDGKYLAQAMTMKRDLEEIKKYSPQLRERIDGDISVEMGELGKVGAVRKAFTGKTPWTSRMTKGITIMDNIAVGITWNAVKLEVKDKHPELEGQEFYKTVAKRTEEIIRHTQSVYDVKDRSELGRSRSLAWRMATRFTSQRNVTYNALSRVILDYNQSDKTAKDTATLLKKLFILTVVASLAEEMVNKLRDKAYGRDDDETIWETALKVGQNTIGYTYLLGDATDMIIRGVKSGTFMVDYNNPTIQFGEDVIKGIVEVVNTIDQAISQDVYKSGPNKGKLKWKYSAKRAAVKAITVASRLKGLPYDNARKLAAAAWDKLTMTDEELKAEMKKAQETKDYKRYAELRQELMKRSRK